MTRSYLFTEDLLGTAALGIEPTDHQVKPANSPGLVRTSSSGNPSGILDYEMDPEIIAAEKAEMIAGLTSAPTLAITLPVESFFGVVDGICANSSLSNNDSLDPLGLEWRRLASFDPTMENSDTQENGEITISGGVSRNYRYNSKHNFRLIFNARNSVLGKNDWLMPAAPFSSSLPRMFKQLQLRNSTQDRWTIRDLNASPKSTVASGYTNRRDRAAYIREAWARKVFREMNPLPPPALNGVDLEGGAEPEGNLIAHRRWIHVFINGLYWGIYDMTERVGEDFARTYLDRGEDYDVFKSDGSGTITNVDGSIAQWNTLLTICSTAGFSTSDTTAWEEVLKILDLDSYLDYLIVNFYMNNRDWGSNGTILKVVWPCIVASRIIPSINLHFSDDLMTTMSIFPEFSP